jgi:hypothetical protein
VVVTTTTAVHLRYRWMAGGVAGEPDLPSVAA